MVAVFTAFLELFQELGLTSAVIQKQDATEEQLSTVFFVTVVLGLVLAALTALGAPLVAAFYREPELVPITVALGGVFFIDSFVHVHAALLRKALDFKKFVLIGICSRVIASALGISLALAGFGVYALVFQRVLGALIYSGAIWMVVPWRPRTKPRLRSALGMLGFGANVTGLGMLSYLTRNMDYLLIGRFLGAASLGVYTIAYRIMLLPLRRISSQLSQVAFPAFSAVQDDKPRVRRGYLQMAQAIALVTFPAMMGVMLVAPEAIPALLGDKWQRVVPLIQILAIAGALQAVVGPTTHIFRSQGRPDLHLKYELFATPLTLLAIALGLRWGVEGVAAGYTLSQLIVLPGRCYLVFGLIGMTRTELYRAFRGPLCATGAMAGAVYAVRVLLFALMPLPTAALLCLEVLTGVATYGVSLYLVSAGTYRELTVAAMAMLSGKRRQLANSSERMPAESTD